MPACGWTERHSDQGFARRSGTVAFGTVLEFGSARVRVAISGYEPAKEYNGS